MMIISTIDGRNAACSRTFINTYGKTTLCATMMGVAGYVEGLLGRRRRGTGCMNMHKSKLALRNANRIVICCRAMGVWWGGGAGGSLGQDESTHCPVTCHPMQIVLQTAWTPPILEARMQAPWPAGSQAWVAWLSGAFFVPNTSGSKYGAVPQWGATTWFVVVCVSLGASVHSAGTTREHRAHERKKLGVFATIGNILAYTNHTTPPQRWTA